jgi:cytoskeletal protein RodZ
MKQDQETLGRYLKRERETRHVTVEEIALFVGVKRSLADALEADDFDCYPRRGECLRVVQKYITYLNLNQTDVLRRFEAQWKKSGSVKRYPKLTQFTDRDAAREKKTGFKGKKLFAGRSPVRTGWLSFIVGLLIVVLFLFHYLPEWKLELLQPQPSPPSKVENNVTPAAKPSPPTPVKASGDAAPKRVPAVDPLYTPPGRSTRNPVTPPTVTTGGRDGTPKHVPAIDPLYSPPARTERKPVPPAKGIQVVGNRDTKRYHLPGMKYHDKVKAYHRVVFQSEREAIRAGYVKARE